MGLSFFFFYLLLIFFSTPELTHVNSRTLPNVSKTTTLDVQALTQNTQNVFSLNPKTTLTFNQQQQQQQQQSLQSVPTSSSSHSLSLHSRIFLHKPKHSDYKSLTLARLERDSARVISLTTRLYLALKLKGITNSELKPLNAGINGSELEAEQVQGPIISGTSQGSGEYFCRVGIGKPPTPAYLVLDTGSDVSWVQCAPCADCYQQAGPIYQPNSSSSYSPLSCETQQCKSLEVSECRNGTCLYEVSYGDGSYTVGDFISETISLGSTSVNNVAIGCGHNNEGLFVGAAGLLGLGGGPMSFPSQLNARTFSYCLVDRDSDSASTLEFDSLPHNAVTAPLIRNPELNTFFYIGMMGLSVGGELLQISESAFKLDENGNGGIIVDSGTAVTRLQTDTYNALRKAFVNGTQHLTPANGVALFDTCYNLSDKTSVEVPTVSFHFPEGKMLPLPAKNYLIPVDSEGTYCFGFAATTSALSIIGNVQQQGTRVSIDFANSLIGFSPNSC